MMKKSSCKDLLREHIRQIILEDGGGDFGGFGDYAGFGMGGMGGGAIWGYGMGEKLNGFISPFTDVFKIAAGEAKKLSRRAQTVLSVAFETLLTTAIPWVSDSYGEIFSKASQDIDKIKQEYAEVYKTTYDAFKNEDFNVAAFMYAPAQYLTARAAYEAPGATAQLLSIISGGALDGILSKIKGKLGKGPALPSWEKFKRELNRYEYEAGRELGYDVDAVRAQQIRARRAAQASSFTGAAAESIMREADESKDDKKNASIAKSQEVLANPKLINAAVKQPYAQAMIRDMHKVIDTSLNAIYEKTRALAGANSIDALEKVVGKKLPDKVKAPLTKMKPEERRTAEAMLLKGIKMPIKQGTVKELDHYVKAAMKAGVPQDHPLIKAYTDTISKIKAL